MKWKTLILSCSLLLIFLCAGCASQYSQHTKASLTYTEDGRPVFTLDNDKSYDGLKIDVIKRTDGSYDFHYSAERTDANGAIKAVAESNAKLAGVVGNLAGSAVGLAVGVPVH